MKVGKYTVRCGAEGNPQDGYHGYAVLMWNEGAQTLERKITFDELLQSEEEATAHARAQVHLRAMSGEL